MRTTKESNLDSVLSKIADQRGPCLARKLSGAERSLREIIEYYYRMNYMENYKELADRYIQEHSGRNKKKTCGACNGSGYYDVTGSPPCAACNGTGKE